MPEFLARPLEWFRGRSRAQQVLIGVGVLIVLAVASQAVAAVAGLVFLGALIALVVQLVRRRPVRPWAIAAGGALVVALVFGGLSSALYGPTEDQAGVNQAEEEPVVEEEPEPPAPEPEPEPVEEEEEGLTALSGVSASEAVSIAEDLEMECERDEVRTDIWRETVWETRCTHIDEHELEYSMTVWEMGDTDRVGMLSGDVADFWGRRHHGVAIEYLGAIALMATDNKESAEEWVADEVPTENAETEIDGTRLILQTQHYENYDSWSLEANPVE